MSAERPFVTSALRISRGVDTRAAGGGEMVRRWPPRTSYLGLEHDASEGLATFNVGVGLFGIF